MMDRSKTERAQKIMQSFMREWREVDPMAVGQMSVEKIDNVSPLIQAMDYFNKLLLQDNEEGHLSAETNEAINDAMIDLARAIVRFACAPHILVKTDD